MLKLPGSREIGNTRTGSNTKNQLRRLRRFPGPSAEFRPVRGKIGYWSGHPVPTVS